MIPSKGEAHWLLPEGDLPYCRLRIDEVQYTRPMISVRPVSARSQRNMEEVLHYARQEGEREQFGLGSAAADAAVRSLVDSVR
jgi:hypothetical protein